MDIIEFVKMLKLAVAEEVAARMKNQPAKLYEVQRTMPDGSLAKKTTELPQVLAELVDALKIAIAQQQILMQMRQEEAKRRDTATNVTSALIGELEAHRKTMKALAKRARSRDDDDDDE